MYCCTAIASVHKQSANLRRWGIRAQAIRELEALGGHRSPPRPRPKRCRTRNKHIRTDLHARTQRRAATDDWKEINSIEEAQAFLPASKKKRPPTNRFKAANVVGFSRRPDAR
jgi:hypothetical protein